MQSEHWVDTPDAPQWDSKYYKVSNLSFVFRVSERAKIQTHAITSRTWRAHDPFSSTQDGEPRANRARV